MNHDNSDQIIPTLSQDDSSFIVPHDTLTHHSPVTGNMSFQSHVRSQTTYPSPFEIVSFLIVPSNAEHMYTAIPQFSLPHSLPRSILDKFLRESHFLERFRNHEPSRFLLIRPRLYVLSVIIFPKLCLTLVLFLAHYTLPRTYASPLGMQTH